MVTKRRKKTKSEETHTHLAVQVERYDMRVQAAVNCDVYAPQYAWELDDDDPLYHFTAQLEIVGTSIYPESRSGDLYEITIYGDDAPSRRLDIKLKDAQERDEYGIARYRSYRGKRIPVFDSPKGMGMLEKVRGESRWKAWLFATPRFVHDALVLLGHEKAVFLAIHECKKERSRWMRGLTLQTTDPSEE